MNRATTTLTRTGGLSARQGATSDIGVQPVVHLSGPVICPYNPSHRSATADPPVCRDATTRSVNLLATWGFHESICRQRSEQQRLRGCRPPPGKGYAYSSRRTGRRPKYSQTLAGSRLHFRPPCGGAERLGPVRAAPHRAARASRAPEPKMQLYRLLPLPAATRCPG